MMLSFVMLWNLYSVISFYSFFASEAAVVCTQLGYQGGQFLGLAGYGPGDGPVWLDNVGCMGVETFLSHCIYNDWGDSNCQHGQDVSVRCCKE